MSRRIIAGTFVVALALAAACTEKSSNMGAGGAKTPPTYVMRVDRTYDRSASSASAPRNPSDAIPNESYKSVASSDKWSVTIEGSRIVIVALRMQAGGEEIERYEGHEVTDEKSSNAELGIKRYDIDKGMFAGGRFIIRGGNEAELTVFGSGVPIISSERGKLVTK